MLYIPNKFSSQSSTFWYDARECAREKLLGIVALRSEFEPEETIQGSGPSFYHTVRHVLREMMQSGES